MLPDFNSDGDLPSGVYQVTLEEAIFRFGDGHPQRREMTRRLSCIYRLARETGSVQHFLVFGSYVTDKAAPNDIDIVLIMQDNFRVEACPGGTKPLFDHEQADWELGASIFWIRPALLILETISEFIAHWQVKRDQTRRGIVEVAT
jgi:hypothetical protein